MWLLQKKKTRLTTAAEFFSKKVCSKIGEFVASQLENLWGQTISLLFACQEVLPSGGNVLLPGAGNGFHSKFEIFFSVLSICFFDAHLLWPGNGFKNALVELNGLCFIFFGSWVCQFFRAFNFAFILENMNIIQYPSTFKLQLLSISVLVRDKNSLSVNVAQ